jgi:hypothetical protein
LTSPATTPSRLVRELVRTLSPQEPALAPAERARVLDDVAAFVELEIAAMPSFLRWPYRTGLRAFDALALARFGRTFVALDGERRARWLAAWSDGRVALFRDFVKPLRMCTLLQHFDHPLVRRALAGGAAAG